MAVEIVTENAIGRIVRSYRPLGTKGEEEWLLGTRQIERTAGPVGTIPAHRMRNNSAASIVSHCVRSWSVRIVVNLVDLKGRVVCWFGVTVADACTDGRVDAISCWICDYDQRASHLAADSSSDPSILHGRRQVEIDVTVLYRIHAEDVAVAIGESEVPCLGMMIDAIVLLSCRLLRIRKARKAKQEEPSYPSPGVHFLLTGPRPGRSYTSRSSLAVG